MTPLKRAKERLQGSISMENERRRTAITLLKFAISRAWSLTDIRKESSIMRGWKRKYPIMAPVKLDHKSIFLFVFMIFYNWTSLEVRVSSEIGEDRRNSGTLFSCPLISTTPAPFVDSLSLWPVQPNSSNIITTAADRLYFNNCERFITHVFFHRSVSRYFPSLR